jgi:hypothetical protein
MVDLLLTLPQALEKAIKSKQDKLKEAVRREKQVPDQVQNIATEVATSTADMFIHLGSLVSIHSHVSNTVTLNLGLLRNLHE